MARTAVTFPRWVAPAIAFLAALGMVLALDLFTNTLDTQAFSGDFRYYIDMTENGLMGNAALVAPFAYRVVTPLVTRMLMDFFALSIEQAYRALAFIGAVIRLWTIYFL